MSEQRKELLPKKFGQRHDPWGKLRLVLISWWIFPICFLWKCLALWFLMIDRIALSMNFGSVRSGRRLRI